MCAFSKIVVLPSYSSTGKPQFAAWLLEQVDSGLYAGLRYVDNQSKFRVPWKHNSRKDCSEEDIQIFRVRLYCNVKRVDVIQRVVLQEIGLDSNTEVE